MKDSTYLLLAILFFVLHLPIVGVIFLILWGVSD